MKIKNATKQGFLEAEVGDGIDISSRMETHRGTVQKGLSQTLTTQGGENVGVMIKDDDLVDSGKVQEGDIVKHSYTRQIMSGKKKPIEKQDSMITLTTRADTIGTTVKQNDKLRIRKLTERECMRLMGFEDKDVDAVKEAGLSPAAIYHIAGDSIIVSVLVALFSQLVDGCDYKDIINNTYKYGD